jgi:hypothetical protein
MHQMLATHYVISSLTLFALGCSYLTSGFCLGTLSVASPSAIVGPILDTTVISHDVEGASCEELVWCINSCLLHLFTAPARARCFASLVVTPRGYKAGSRPYVQPMAEKKEW